MIIWDEYKFGKEIHNNGTVKTKKWQTNELRTLIKYLLIDKPEMINADIRKEIEKCCTDEIKYLSQKQKTNIFNKLIQQCLDSDKKVKIIKDNKVTIYQSEIDKIKELKDSNMEQLVFALLVYSKWLGLKWFSISKSDLQKESKTTNVNSQKLQDLLSDLFEKEYIKSDVIKLDKHERRKEKIQKKQMWSIDWLQDDGDIAFEFSNYDNFVYRYLNYVYGGYFECEVCGGMFKQSKQNNKRMCNKCQEYKPIETKTIKCTELNCDKEFEVDAKDNKTCRCEFHQKEFDKKRKREWKRKNK